MAGALSPGPLRQRTFLGLKNSSEHIGAAIETGNLVSFPREGAGMDSRPASEVQHRCRARRVAPDNRGNKFNFFRVVFILVQQIILIGISAKHTQCSTSRTASATVRICVSVSAIPLGR